MEEHLDDAEYLFQRWEAALDGPESLAKLAAGPEPRLSAHLNGLVHGGVPVVERLLFPAMLPGGEFDAFDERARRCAAALAILQQPVGGTERLVAAAAEQLDREGAGALHRALQLWDRPGSDSELWKASLRTRPESWPAWLRTFAIRGQPADENMVNYCLRGDEDAVLAGLSVVPDMIASVGAKVHDVLDYFFGDRKPALRVAALHAALSLGSPRAWALCREWFASPGAPRGIVELVAIVGSEAEHRQLIATVADGHVDELRVWALGHTGRAGAAELCVELFEHPSERIVRLAFEGFCAITGLSPEAADASVPETRPGARDLADPDGQFASDERARDAAADADEAAGLDPMVLQLPLPNVDLVRQWWARSRGHFRGRGRYLHGRPSTVDVMQWAYIHASSRRRHLLGEELRMRCRSRVQPSTRAFAARQLRQLRELYAMREQGLLRIDPQRGYLEI